jgi:hypothetical protein
MKNLPYWAKGGIFAVIVSIISFGVVIIRLNFNLLYFWNIPGQFFSMMASSAFVTSLIIEFIIGAIVGFIYGKTK